MSLNSVETVAKISGAGAKEVAVLLYAASQEKGKTKGKIRLNNMLKSGKELKVFAVQDKDLKKFCIEAKKYGVLYCILKDKNSTDGLTDIMVRAEDASKINRIFERFNLATVDMASIENEIQQSKVVSSAKDTEELLDILEGKVKPDFHKARKESLNQSGLSSKNIEATKSTDSERSSVRKELKEIKAKQRNKPKNKNRQRGIER